MKSLIKIKNELIMKKKYLLIVFLLALNITTLKAQLESGTYLQEIKTEVQLPIVAGNNVINLV